MLYGIYSIKHYYFIIINENNYSLMSQLRQAPTADGDNDDDDDDDNAQPDVSSSGRAGL